MAPRLLWVVVVGLIAFATPAYAVDKTAGSRLETPRLLEYRIAHPAVQSQLTADSLAWHRFESHFGAGLHVDWNERSHTPLRIYGRPLPFGDAKMAPAAVSVRASEFLESIEDLMGTPRRALHPVHAHQVNNVWYLQYQRYAGAYPVENAFVELRVRNGELVMIKLDSHPDADAALQQPRLVSRERALALARADLEPSAGLAQAVQSGELVVLPVALADRYDYRLAWVNELVTTEEPGQWRTHIDAETGAVLRRENLYKFVDGTIRGRVEPRTIGDQMVDMRMPYIRVTIGGADVDAAATGQYSHDLAGTATARLLGSYTNVNNQQATDAQVTFDANASPADFVFTDSDADQAEIAGYRHTETVKKWARSVAPELNWVNNQLTVNVNVAGTCNAYWNGSSTNFFRAGGSCNNTARIADVVYHEFGHGFHQNIVESGTVSGSIGEGSGDYISVTITNSPDMAPGFFTNGDSIRSAENNKIYPDDLSGEVHADGEIWVGTMWDLRKLLIARYGYEEGKAISDSIFAGVLRTGPTFSDVYSEALLADDDDNDLANGVPHQCEIDEAFGLRGFGPAQGGTPSFLPLSHTEVTGPLPATGEIPVVVAADSSVSPCGLSDPEKMTLHWTIDGSTFNDVTLAATANPGEFSGAIPAPAAGNVVQYYVTGTQGTVTSETPARAPANLYGFYVGDLETVWSDDFETDTGWTHGLDTGDGSIGQDDWQRGTPSGIAGDPMSAYSGNNVWGNDLGLDELDGRYEPNIKNWLESPEIDCTACQGARLQYRRWLSVEDGDADHARIYVNGTLVWENAASGTGSVHRRDSVWTFHDIDISSVADGQTIKIRYELESDAGLQLGGWTIDDVTIVQPVQSGPVGDDDDDNQNPGTPGDDPGCSCSVAPQGTPPWSVGLLLLGLVVGLARLRRRRT